MQLLEQITVKQESDITYAKIAIRNKLQALGAKSQKEFLEFAAAELGSNLIKHANRGQLLLFKQEDLLYLASLDKGPGIINPHLAMTKGYTTQKNSLGIGLYALSTHEDFQLTVFSNSFYKKQTHHGTVVLLTEKTKIAPYGLFSIPFDIKGYNGDFFKKKGSHFIFGDAAGHGKAAALSAELILELFGNHDFAQRTCQEFFFLADRHLKTKNLRGAVFSLINLSPQNIEVWGIGNILTMSLKLDKIAWHFPTDGMVGNHITHVDCLNPKLSRGDFLILTSDGINHRLMTSQFLSQLRSIENPMMISLIIYHYYARINDDASILTIRKNHD